MRDASQLLVDLVKTPSPSGSEEQVARLLEGWAARCGLTVSRDDAAVKIEVRGPVDGPTLLLASHLDTVPPGEGWVVDPWAGIVRDGVLHARGAVDAKGSVAAMAAAARTVARYGGPARGRLVVLATYSEETRDTTMPKALERLRSAPDAAIVGEPTGLAPCIAQRGLMIVGLVWTGPQLHAGWAADLTERPESAVVRAARDLLRLESLSLGAAHPVAGETVATVTELRAGIARNVTPPRCEALVDIRTTPAVSHEEIARRLREGLDARVEVLSDRLRPASTPEGSRLLEVICGLRPESEPIASPTSSDWAFLRDIDAVKLGPGDSRLSHTVDEAVPLADVDAAADLYAAIAQEYLS